MHWHKLIVHKPHTYILQEAPRISRMRSRAGCCVHVRGTSLFLLLLPWWVDRLLPRVASIRGLLWWVCTPLWGTVLVLLLGWHADGQSSLLLLLLLELDGLLQLLRRLSMQQVISGVGVHIGLLEGLDEHEQADDEDDADENDLQGRPEGGAT
jgi:hypothetical protein